MIFKKDASFSYPIYSPVSNNYVNNNFSFDIDDLREEGNELQFTISCDFDSDFIKDLYQNNIIEMYLVIQSKDSKFLKVEPGKNKVSIPKQRIALSHRTTLQLHLISKEEISFENCNDLNSFYTQFKSEIIVHKNAMIGYSAIVTYDGDGKKPLELFKRETKRDLEVPFRVLLDDRLIILQFKDDKYLMEELYKKGLINMYLYTGLSRALTRFIRDYGENGEIEDLESVAIDNHSLLDQKLYDLMINKSITDLGLDDLDNVITKITENLLDKFVEAVMEVSYEDD